MDSLFSLGESSRLAVALPDGELSWDELSRACAGHRAEISAAGVLPGDRVAVWAHPTTGTVAAILGNLACGVVTVPLNPQLGETELDHILQDARPRHILDRPPVVLGAASELFVEVDNREALIIYTSGTTGPPKGAVLTVRNLATSLDGLADAWLWSEDDVVVHALPLFHVHGLVLGLLGSLRVGGAMRSIGRFDVDRIAQALAGDGTMLFAVPTMYHRMAKVIGDRPALQDALRSARMLVSGSASLAPTDARILEEVAGVQVYQRYGLTETLINCAARFGEPVRRGTVGRALSGVEVAIVDDARSPLGPGQIGEIAVRGDNVFPGYLNQPEATAEVLADDGWFYTGDVGEVDALGVVTVHGRKSTDLIKSGGYKIGAGEIETCLLEHPAVGEVAVLGVADDDLGERVVACVVATGPCEPQALIEWVGSRLSSYKRPREIAVVDKLPRNAMGKVQKALLRGRFEAT